MYGGVGPEVRFGQRKDSDWVSLYICISISNGKI